MKTCLNKNSANWYVISLKCDSLSIFQACLLPFVFLAARAVAAEPPNGVDPFFAGTPVIKFEQTSPIALMPYVQPVIFAPVSGEVTGGVSNGYSCYIGGIGAIQEIRLDSGKVIRHAIPFDYVSDQYGGAGTENAWLGPDGRIYWGMNGKPGRIARFDPATSRMELIATLDGHAALNCCFGPGNKAYFVNYPAILTRIDMVTGEVRKYGRLGTNNLYVFGKMWIGKDGAFYCRAGSDPGQDVRVDVETGEMQVLAESPSKAGHPDTPKAAFPDLAKQYTVTMKALPERVTVTITPKEGVEGKVIMAEFSPLCTAYKMHSLAVGTDGNIYGCGSHSHFIFNPATRVITRLNIKYNPYDYAAIGSRLYFAGYNHARLGVFDTTRPMTALFDGGAPVIPDELKEAQHNPCFTQCFYNKADTSHPKDEPLKMSRIWSMEASPDGRLWMGMSATRHASGGALVAYRPVDQTHTAWRTPDFRLLGVRSICPVNEWKQLAIATWVSPDPNLPGQEPPAAKLFLFDVERGEIFWGGEPLPGCKVLKAVIQPQGTARLVGIGLRDVNPMPADDDSFYGKSDIFVFDLAKRQTVASFPMNFEVGLREGRALVSAPDGSIWAAGGGGLLRIDAANLKVTPIAQCDPAGTFIFVGRTLYMVGGKTLRWADVSQFLAGDRRPLSFAVSTNIIAVSN